MISGRTAVYALLGHPVEASPSPRLHNAWFTEHGCDARYVALPVPAPDGVADAIRTLGLAGVNLTIPLKEAVTPQLDRLDRRAEVAGSVNTVFRDGDRLVGSNTDGEGLCRALRADGIDVSGRRGVVVGAGGAARGVAAALLAWGVEDLRVVNRTVPRGQAMVADLARWFPSARLRAEGLVASSAVGAEIVVVCTTPGASGVASLDPTLLAPDGIWYDINYRRPALSGLTSARAAGHRGFDGWGMLCWQAALAFEGWTGVLPDAQHARRHLQPPSPPESC